MGDFFQQISGEAARLANGKRVSLKEVMAAVNLVLGRSKLAERCIAAGVEAIKHSGCLKGDKGDKASSYKDKEKSADFKDKASSCDTPIDKDPTPSTKIPP